MATLDTATGAKVKAYTVAGPASYATGGFALDCSADFTSIGFVDVTVVTRGVLPAADFEIDVNVDLAGVEANGKAVIKIVRGRYNRATIGAVTGPPGGVAVQAAKFAAATTTGSAHTHTVDHNHAAVTSATESANSGAANTGATNNFGLHTHSFDVPAFAGASTSTTHAHERAFEYEHVHALTVSTIDVAAVEIAAATNLSGVAFVAVVFGFGKA